MSDKQSNFNWLRIIYFSFAVNLIMLKSFDLIAWSWLKVVGWAGAPFWFIVAVFFLVGVVKLAKELGFRSNQEDNKPSNVIPFNGSKHDNN